MADFESNINQVIIDLEKQFVKPFSDEQIGRLMNDVTSGILRTMKRRIFREGLDVNLAPIGAGIYSTKPAYFNPNKGSVKIGLANTGKTGKSKFKTGKSHKTRYYSQGYKEFRGANNKITNKVNLEFKGDLRRALTFQKLNNKYFTVGFSTNKEYRKANGLERKYNQNIFGIGTRESKTINDVLNIYIK